MSPMEFFIKFFPCLLKYGITPLYDAPGTLKSANVCEGCTDNLNWENAHILQIHWAFYRGGPNGKKKNTNKTADNGLKAPF